VEVWGNGCFPPEKPYGFLRITAAIQSIFARFRAFPRSAPQVRIRENSFISKDL
jgi:hypothetical protein